MRKGLWMLLAAAVSATPAAAQIPLSIEGRVDAAIPTGDFADVASTAPSFSASAAFGLAPGFGVYGGYSMTEFDLEGSDGEASDEGFSVGLTAALPVAGLPSPWVGAGLVFHEFEVEGGGLEIEGDTEMGFEVGAGVAVPVTPRVRLTPAVGYRTFEVDLLGLGTDRVSYFSAGVGLNISF